MPSIESTVIQVVVEVSDQLSARLTEKLEFRRVSSWTVETERLLRDLGRDADALLGYLESPDFAAVAAQQRFGATMDAVVKDQLCQGLRLAGIPDQLLERSTDVVHDVLVTACQEARPVFAGASAKIDQNDLVAAAAITSLLLKGLTSLTRIHAFAARMRSQVAALHSQIRLPHAGVSRSVEYTRLYIEPTLASPFVLRLGAPGQRVLVQGDPGAGKSTLAAKFAHDIANDGSGRVPFLLVLREFTAAFDEGGRDLPHYLEKLCQAPYNVKPPPDGVEYLLRTGRAVVVLDGLDELVRTELRRRVVALVEGFAHLYPLVPILVTARKIGYEDAPLSADLFVPSHIAEFDDEQVTGYVSRWFELDEATSPVERERLATSFMEDSRQITELRSNPLLLTLLCAMYSSDRYLPQNLAQVYERCALMLFEQWDSKRGIALPLRFHGRLRGAVQHLAWKMLNAKVSGKALSRTRIVNVLTGYLDAKIDDHDESVAMAEEFLAFCTGRAWILTDVGATESEAQYGFTHRTFLEYFAAEYLVRTHRTAAELWKVLSPQHDQWDVVAQIVLQLYDRNVEGGVDELLTEALANEGVDFAARSLHHVHPSTRTVRAITTEAVDRSVRFPLDLRIDTEVRDLTKVDGPLRDCMYASSPVNLPLITQVVTDRFSTHIRDGEAGVALVLDFMIRNDLCQEGHLWRQRRQELTALHQERLDELRKAVPWAGGSMLFRPEILHEILHRFGVRTLYSRCMYLDTDHVSAVTIFMRESGQPFSPAVANDIAVTMTTLPVPWAERRHLRGISWEVHRISPDDSLKVLLSLPPREMNKPVRRNLPFWWQKSGLPPEVRDFLEAWERGELSVLDPARQPPPPHPEQH
ncbi:NACHT domain-containing protein [Lentzea sp. NPDC092896]|uniref:NACHT domain-containing protein n=1 Tax=Lentzea sp. NPDC092896 TaxID=3364127 RepID=UPI0037F52564